MMRGLITGLFFVVHLNRVHPTIRHWRSENLIIIGNLKLWYFNHIGLNENYFRSPSE